MMKPNYDKFPRIQLDEVTIWSGWESCMHKIRQHLSQSYRTPKSIIVLECYPGIHYSELKREIGRLYPDVVIFEHEWMKSEESIRQLTRPDVSDDPLFGRRTTLTMADFIESAHSMALRKAIEKYNSGIIVIAGTGASLVVPDPDLLVYLDMPRWEIQKRMKKRQVKGLGVDDSHLDFSQQYKRGYFVDWQVCDRLKTSLFEKIDFYLDTTRENDPRMMIGHELRSAYAKTVTRPFRVAPYFDPGPWGGRWMQQICDLEPIGANYAWCFDCVPEENSLLIESSGKIFESPSINLVLRHPEQLLGHDIYKRFGAEFPIRFDFLDTMDGGNLSFQVHPDNHYIRRTFGMEYTQDESYYLLDAGPDASVYLGLKEDVEIEEMFRELQKAQSNGNIFDAGKFANVWPARKHDHFLIPAGTVHCSGKNAMVLEISATPFIFTFKMWDWGRMGLDGKPRPINLKHAREVVNPKHDTRFAREELINQVKTIREGIGWREESTGLHRLEFIETRRHWFTGEVPHDTQGTLNVLNLVEGPEARVFSPDGSFEPFLVHYAETFIIPACVGPYCIAPTNRHPEAPLATIKAFVRPGFPA